MAEAKKDTRPNPETIVKQTKSKSEAVRALAAAGYTTAEIASEKGPCKDLQILKYGDGRMIRYQHVRNVLTQPLKKAEAKAA